LLNWQVDLASGVGYFEIQSSTDTSDFTSKEKIQGKENERNYQFTDDRLPNGIIYYRIKLVEKTGEEHFSKIVAVNNNSVFNFYIVSSIPQISNNNLIVHLTSPAKTSMQFIFVNEIGSVVKKNFMHAEAGNNSASFDISNFATGVYILRAVDAIGNSQTRRFVKQ